MRANDTDIDGGRLAIQSFTQGAHGAVSFGGNGNIYYRPAANFSGEDSFTYTLNGGSTATVHVTIVADDDAPVASGDTATTAEDKAIAIDVLANDTDIDGGPKFNASFTQGAHGTVSAGDDGKLVYTPSANFFGEDSFTYTLNGGSTATVKVTITAVDDAPVAQPDQVVVAEDGSVAIDVLANDTDIDGGPKFVQSFGPAAHGTISLGQDGKLLYTPDANFSGVDGFTYTLNGGSTATVAIQVTAVDDMPVAFSDRAEVEEDGQVVIDVLANDTDIDGGAKFVQSVTQGAHGSVTIGDDGRLLYKPAADYNGTDTFSYRLNGGSETTVSVDVTPVNDRPTAGPVTGRIVENTLTALDGNLLSAAADVDGDRLSIANPGTYTLSYGTLTVNANGTYSYRLDNANPLVDAMTPASPLLKETGNFIVTDGKGGEATVALTIEIAGAKDAAVITGTLTGAVQEDLGNPPATGGTLFITDPDGGEAHFILPSAADLKAKYGQFSFDNVNNSWQYTLDNTAAQELISSDSIKEVLTVRTVDGTSTAIEVTVTGKDDKPIIYGNLVGSVTEDGNLTTVGTLIIQDQDKGQAAFQPIADSALKTAYGKFSFNASTGAWSYALDNKAAQALNADSNVSEYLTVTALDGGATKTVRVDITGVTDPDIFVIPRGASYANNDRNEIKYWTITGFDDGFDKLSIPGWLPVSGRFTYNYPTQQSEQQFVNSLEALGMNRYSYALGAGTVNVYKFQGNTYLLADSTWNNLVDNIENNSVPNDVFIKIIGDVTIDASDFVYT